MALLLEKKSSNKNKVKDTQENKRISLGKAPDDIYDLENEIASFQSQQQNENLSVNDLEQKQENENTETIVDQQELVNDENYEYELFSSSNLLEAKQSLQNGSKIKVKLPENVSPHALIAMAHSLGFDTFELQKLFENSSVIVKNIMDEYVENLKSKYSSLATKANINQSHSSTAFGGYLFHCKQIDALQCDNDLSAKIRIKMDLDYTQTVIDDELFRTKFKYELSNKVFKCPSNNIRIQDVRAGSVIAVIAGITLITLATVGLLTLSVKMHNRKKLKEQQLKQNQVQSQMQAASPWEQSALKKQSGCMNDNNGPSTSSVSVQQQPPKKQLQANKYKEIKRIKPKPVQPVQAQQETFVSSIFNKIKTGINSFNEQYSDPPKGKSYVFGGNRPTPNGSNVKVNQVQIDEMTARLIAMGFKDTLCAKAAKQHPTNINEAINWIMDHENDADIEDKDDNNKHPDIANDEFILVDDNDNNDTFKSPQSQSVSVTESPTSPRSSIFASLKASVSRKSISEEKENFIPSTNNNENLILSINDPLWINKKGQFWPATVIALTRDKVTVEYDKSGPYLWRKTETFALNDPCLNQRQPGMKPEFEGYVTISKTNGGFIKAWKSGLERPMADI